MRTLSLCLAGCLATATVWASVDSPVDVGAQAKGANKVVVATVTDVQSAFGENDFGDRLILSQVTFRVDETMKGPQAGSVVVTVEGDYLVLTMYRSRKAAAASLPDELRERLSKAELVGWEWLAGRDTVTTAEYEEAMKLPNRTAKNHLRKLTELGLLKMTGAGRATRYKVIRL